jgi:uncharacterized protein YndB with AHSA1/START domain
MPTVSRARSVPAAVEEVWRTVGDPRRLPEWWPGVERVEDVSSRAWTLVLGSPRGKAVRADYTLVDAEPPRRLRWRQQLEESPFERLLSESSTDLELEPRSGGSTALRLTARLRLRGISRLGWVQVRRATRRQLDAALDALSERFSSQAER